MAPFTMTVRGHATIPRKAERAVLDVEISSEGTDRKTISKEVADSSKQLQSILKTKSQDSQPDSEPKQSNPVTKWTMDSFNTTSYLPRDDKYNIIKDAERIYVTSVSFRIELDDFAQLGALISKLLNSVPHAKVHNVSWKLTEETQQPFEAELRRKAASSALQRARDYAEPLGFTVITPVELREDGASLMQAGVGDLRKRKANAPAREDEKSFEDVEFVPEEIKMTAGVECKFEAV